MKAVILCAGLGLRLRPLTERWPKPAVPVLGQPLIRYTLAVLKRAGVDGVCINLHHLAATMETVARSECERVGVSLAVVHEPVIQGTGGGIRGMRSFLGDEPFVVFNGDILFALDFHRMISMLHTSANMSAAATMLLMPMPSNESYASVETDVSGAVRRIAGHGPGGDRLQGWHFTGVHFMTPTVFDFMRSSGPEDINRDVYPRLLEAGLGIHGEIVDLNGAYWSDLGTPRRYLSTHLDLLTQKVPMSGFTGASPFDAVPRHRDGYWCAPSVQLNQAHVVGPSLFGSECEIGHNVEIDTSVIGTGARIGAGARITRTVVLESAIVAENAQLQDSIVCPSNIGTTSIVVSANH